MVKRSVILWFLLVLSAFAADPRDIGPNGRKDILRKAIAFYSATVPRDRKPPVDLALTVIETFERNFHAPSQRAGFTWEDEMERHGLKQMLVGNLQTWWDKRLESGGGPLTPGFLGVLRSKHSADYGRNVFLVVSDPEDYTKILALLRIAKPGISQRELPVQRQFEGEMRPLPKLGFTPVPRNVVRIYSYAHDEPYLIEIQNAKVYEGDWMELKHFGAILSREVDLTGLLFHAGQELGLFSVSRYVHDGTLLNLPPGPALITPGGVVIESDHEPILDEFLAYDGYEVHGVFPGAIHPDKRTLVLRGPYESFARGHHAKHAKRRLSAGLKVTKIHERTDAPFLTRLLGGTCSEALLQALAKLDFVAQDKLRRTIPY